MWLWSARARPTWPSSACAAGSSTSLGAQGSWESTGVVDASSVFGPGAFLINVQAHTLWIEQSAAPDWTNKREGGQLMLLRIPGA